MANNPINGELG